MEFLTDSPFFPLIAATLGVALATHVYKAAMRAAGLRHHRLVERTLPLVPAVIGAVAFGAFPHEFAVPELVNGGHHSIHVLGAFFGLGLGFASSGAFRAVIEYLPAPVREALTLPDYDGADDG